MNREFYIYLFHLGRLNLRVCVYVCVENPFDIADKTFIRQWGRFIRIINFLNKNESQ